MIVRELIEQLKKLPQDDLVVLTSDSEGNYYNTLYKIYTGFFREGEFADNEDVEWRLEEYEDDFLETSIPCVVLAP
jgi:hypothetical protein